MSVEAAIVDVVGEPWREVSSGFACGRRGASGRFLVVEGPLGQADVWIQTGAPGDFRVTPRENRLVPPARIRTEREEAAQRSAEEWATAAPSMADLLGRRT